MSDPLALETLLLQAGNFGTGILVWGAIVLVTGVIALVRGVPISFRWGFSIACCLPSIIGLMGTIIIWMTVYSILGTSGIRDSSKLFAVLVEVCAPLLLGLFASAILMTLAVLVWMRSRREAPPSAPPLPPGA